MQAQSVALKAQLSHEEGSSRELCERINTLQADLSNEAKRAVTHKDEVDCLRIELADAGADAQGSLHTLAVRTQSLIVCKLVKDKALSIPMFCLTVCKAFYKLPAVTGGHCTLWHAELSLVCAILCQTMLAMLRFAVPC